MIRGHYVRARSFIGCIGVVLIVTSMQLLAHHSFAAEYDGNKPITLRGVITKIELINPHSWIYIDVKGSDGSVVHWAIETGAPNALIRRGWRSDSVPVGTVIVVEGFLAKNGKSIVNGRDLMFTDGRKLFIGSSGTGAPDDPKQ